MKRIIGYSMFCILVLLITEQLLELPYLIKTLIKLPMFLMVPLLSFSNRRVFKVKFNYKNVFVQGLGVFSIVMLAFLVLSRFIDFETIRADFSSRLEITKSMFVWASIYTVFINAMVEEVFFRAYILVV